MSFYEIEVQQIFGQIQRNVCHNPNFANCAYSPLAIIMIQRLYAKSIQSLEILL